MTTPRVRFLEHTADVGIDADADTFADLFRAAADGMFQLLLGEDYRQTRDATAEPEARRIVLAAEDAAGLLAGWLRELLFLYETAGVMAVAVDFLALEPLRLDATVQCARTAGQPLREIKGVTYHQLDVRRGDGGWHARVIFDV